MIPVAAHILAVIVILCFDDGKLCSSNHLYDILSLLVGTSEGKRRRLKVKEGEAGSQMKSFSSDLGQTFRIKASCENNDSH